MAFQNNFYDMDDGGTIRYRVSDEEAAAVDAAGGPATLGFRAYSSGSRRRFGIHTRGLGLSRIVGTAPNTFARTSFIAIPTEAEFDSISEGDNLSVDGVTWTVSSKIPERRV